MCPKLPLVIRVIGSLMTDKFTVQEWKSFERDQLQNFASYGRGVMDILKLSYEHLEWRLKLCVTYCSLFPREKAIDKTKIIHLWIALGYVVQQYANQSLEDAAEEYVSQLRHRGFFYPDFFPPDAELRMPNLMHELVVWVGGFKYSMADFDTIEFDERVQHVSYKAERDSSWSVPPSLFKIKQLQSLVIPLPDLSVVHEVHFPVIDMCVFRFQDLSVLRLSRLGIKDVPTFIGKLVLLRYLDLSNNPMRKLPNSITNLVNLYLLDLSHCRMLQKLPKGMSKLVKLRHLYLYGCWQLSHMPREISNLTPLQTLDYFILGIKTGCSSFKSEFCGLVDLINFNNVGLTMKVNVASPSKHLVQEANIASMVGKEKITGFTVSFGDAAKQDEMVLDCLQPSANLTTLNIYCYGGERLPHWMRDQLHCWLPNLVTVSINTCHDCKYLCSFGRLPHLQQLYLLNMNNLEYIENSSRGNDDGGEQSSSPLFPSLLYLVLVNLPKLKGWWSVGDTGQLPEDHNQHHIQNWMPSFPKLNHVIMDMQIVTIMAREVLQGVSSLEIENRADKERDEDVEGDIIMQEPIILLKNYLPNLHRLTFFVSGIKILPEEFRAMSSLKELLFYGCHSLEGLPEWIDSLTSLTRLDIKGCRNLKSLPQGISSLSNLNRLHIRGCSKELEERCQQPTGEDWLKIQHIPDISIESFN